MNVLVYSGRGVSAEALHHTVYSLRASVGAFYDIKLVTAASLTREPWEENCSLLVMPGGRDVPYEEELNGRACDRIRRWIGSGAGRYLGLCAGAYWACAKVAFEPNTPLAVVGSRELALCPAVARGTIFAGFEYGSDRGAHAARIALAIESIDGMEEKKEQSSIPTYYNGGCWFDFAGNVWRMNGLTYSLVGSYADREHKPAIIAGQSPNQENWSVLLSGVHVEYAAEEVARRRPEAGSWLETLQKGEPARLALWNQLLRRLGLQVRPPLTLEGEVPKPTPLFVGSADGDLNWLRKHFTKGQWPCETTTFCLLTPSEADSKDWTVSDESYPLVICTDLSTLRHLPWTFSLENYFLLWSQGRKQDRQPPIIIGKTLLYAEYINSTQTILSQ